MRRLAAKLIPWQNRTIPTRARAAAFAGPWPPQNANAFATLNAAVAARFAGRLPSPRRSSLARFTGRRIKAVPLLCSGPPPASPSIRAPRAINSLARLQKDNKESRNSLPLISLNRTFPVRMAAIYALVERGDATAIPALETLLKSRRPQHRNGTDDQGADRASKENLWMESPVPTWFRRRRRRIRRGRREKLTTEQNGLRNSASASGNERAGSSP